MASNHWSNPRPATGTRVAAALIVGVGLTLLTASMEAGAWSAGRAPWPFVWRDVALAHLACAVPLAWWLSRAMCGGLPAATAVLEGSIVAGLSTLLMVLDTTPTSRIFAAAMRIATAFGWTLSALVLGRVLLAFREDHQSVSWRRRTAIAVVGVFALAVAPPIYVQARCRHDLARLGEYLDQGRIGEARPLAHALLALDAQAQWRNHPLAEVSAHLDTEAAKLEAAVAVPLPADAAPQARFQRARQLAMLGQTEQALAGLPRFDDALLSADADNLRGTIHEARGEWTQAIALFQRARGECLSRPASLERADILVRATTGVAYNQRKSGDYIAADKSYQDLLAIAPNADTHFLLAQFYEDAQNAGKARQHARRAMTLNPARYQADGEKLIRKLAVFHFGCLRALGG